MDQKKNTLDSKTIKDKILSIIDAPRLDEQVLSSLPVEALIEEISNYHQELYYQNQELLSKSQDLELSRFKYQELFDNAPISYILMDFDTRILQANAHFSRLIGIHPQQAVGRRFTDWIHSEDQDDFYFMIRRLTKVNHSMIEEMRFIVSDETLTTRLNCNVFVEHGERYIRATLNDMTETMQKDKELSELENKFRLLSEISKDSIVTFDVNSGKITYMSKSFSEFVLDPASGLLDRRFQDLIARDDRDGFIDRVLSGVSRFQADPRSATAFRHEFHLEDNSGKPQWVELTGRFLFKSDREVELLCLVRNIQERKEYEEKILFLSQHDQLTGLFNRHAFKQRLNEEIERFIRYGSVASIILLDIDHFKKINDEFGHPVGDIVLQVLAKITNEMVRTTDLVFRVGGEEFLVLLPHIDIKGAVNTAERIRTAINAYSSPEFGKFTCSFGAAELVKGDNLTSWYQKADLAMYNAKETGRNKVCCLEQPKEGA